MEQPALTAADTIKAPLPVAFAPLVIGPRGEQLRWDRPALYAMGSLTLGELLGRIPGVTMMTSGFLIAPVALAWHGDPAGVRVFVDGIERVELTPRNAGVTDFSLIPLWALDEVRVEETAGELRVHARTWRVDRTTASTRTDMLTGSDNLNLFRGFFGKRSASGLAIQVAAQHASTVEPLTRIDGNALGAFARVGWARGDWGVDAAWLHQGLNRNAGVRYLLTAPQPAALPAFAGSTALSYVRMSWRSPDSTGAWVQLMAATLGANLTAATQTGSPPTTTPSDTARSQATYTAMTGVTRGGIRVAAGARMERAAGANHVAPVMQFDATSRWSTLAFRGERRDGGTTTWDVRGLVRPFDWVRIAATLGVSRPSGWDVAPGLAVPGVSAHTATMTSSSVDAAMGLRGRWIAIGVVHRGMETVLAPVELDTAMRAVTLPEASGIKLSVTLPLARGWSVRSDAVTWRAGAAFVPRTEVHTRLWFESDFRRFAPRGNFNVVAAISHDYRSALSTPSLASPTGQTTPGFGSYGMLVEIRISTATVYWDVRNMTGHPYETFPGYLMPRNLSVYGIRWNFWG